MMMRLRLRVDKLHFQFHSPAGFFVDSTCRIHREEGRERADILLFSSSLSTAQKQQLGLTSSVL